MKSHADRIAHLKKDKTLKPLIEEVGPLKLKKNLDLYVALLRSIVSQQLSVKAAATIWQRFLALFNEQYPSPEQLINMPDKTLREAGLSYQKAGYLKNIAQFALEQTLDYQQLRKLEDEVLIEYLVQIKGVGRWTVEMILMFSLQRHDVLPLDDLGIQKGMISLYKIRHKNKKELFKKMERIAETWRPCRTLACLYVWRHKDNKPL